MLPSLRESGHHSMHCIRQMLCRQLGVGNSIIKEAQRGAHQAKMLATGFVLVGLPF